MINARFTRTAISLHWLMALLILGLLGLGIYMADLPLSPQKLKLYSYHKWAGITALLLVMLRLGWRMRHTPPPQLGPRWQQRAARAGHMLLYALMFAAPLSGWLMSSAHGFTTVWFGVLPLPDLVPKDKALADTLKVLHRFINYTFLLLIAGHALAALKHHFINRDSTLVDMLPFNLGKKP